MRNRRLRVAAVLTCTLTLPFLLGACSQRARAERDGRDLADAACDYRDATTADEAAKAKEDFTEELQDIDKRYGAATAEDRNDIQNNLADLSEHSIQGNEVLVQQDLAVLARSARNIAGDTGDVQSAVWNGIADGIEECLQD